MIKYKYIYVIAVACLFSCNNYSIVREINIEPQLSIDNLKDSIYFSDINLIIEDSSEIFMFDDATGKIIITDTNFNYKRSIGEVGNAHNEYTSVSSFSISGDIILVKDSGHNRFQAYDKKGNYLYSYNYLDLPIGISDRFAFRNDKIIISTLDSAFMEINLNNEREFSLAGTRINFDNIMQTAFRNNCSFFYFEDKLISISDNLPIVKIYDKNYILESSCDYQSIEFVDKLIKHNNKSKSVKTYFKFVCDCYVYQDKIYILIAENINKFIANKLIIFQITDNGICVDRTLIMPEGIYTTLCVNNYNIFVFNSTKNCIEKYLN